ncbi:MAG: DUF2341 domain-containing protein, partial [Kiritimatiellae bacterium]|nr:DUF2341 domain-containing protein [Kiritimatiellia bacterium]
MTIHDRNQTRPKGPLQPLTRALIWSIPPLLLLAWHYPEWLCRTPIAIVNATEATLTNQPALLLLDTASLIANAQLRADCADLRITSRTDSPLPFWIEPNTLNSTHTRLWINQPLLSPNTTETCFLYSDMNTAASEASLTNTFPARINTFSYLMAAWLADEAEGSTAHDTSGNANHATLNNVSWTTGRTDAASALLFNGSNAYLSVPHAASLNPTNAFAAEMWVKPNAEFPGWLSPWLYRRKLSVSNTLITADLTNFPVLVKLTNTTFTFTNALATGYDIRFAAADGQTLLSFERERHTAAGAEYWVRLPLVAASTNTTFYLYYGNTNAANAAAASNVWDSQFAMVHHLAQSSSPVYDSTSNANHGVSNRTALGQTGLIGNGIYLAATGAYIECGTTAMPDTDAAQTLEAWAYYSSAPTSPNNQNLLLSADTTSESGIQLGFRGGKTTAWLWGAVLAATSAAPSSSQWHQYVFATEGNADSHALYIDGVRQTALTKELQAGTPNQVRISTSSWGEYFLGRIDEVRLSRGARSTAWITANYQSTRNALLQYGAQETRAAILAGKGRNAWQLETDPARRLHFHLNNTLLLSSSPIETNWIHLVFNYDGATRSILLNGTSLTSASYSATLTANTSNLLIGTNFPGMISEMRLFQRALSTQEIDT